MSTVPWPDEAATKPVPDATSRELVRASRIARIATVALERLMVAPDADVITAVVGDLCEIRALAEDAR